MAFNNQPIFAFPFLPYHRGEASGQSNQRIDFNQDYVIPPPHPHPPAYNATFFYQQRRPQLMDGTELPGMYSYNYQPPVQQIQEYQERNVQQYRETAEQGQLGHAHLSGISIEDRGKEGELASQKTQEEMRNVKKEEGNVEAVGVSLESVGRKRDKKNPGLTKEVDEKVKKLSVKKEKKVKEIGKRTKLADGYGGQLRKRSNEKGARGITKTRKTKDNQRKAAEKKNEVKEVGRKLRPRPS